MYLDSNKYYFLKRIGWFVFCISFLPQIVLADSDIPCPNADHPKGIGPYDYSDPYYHSYASSKGSAQYKSMVDIVDANHFQPIVESLRGSITGTLMGSIAYTLSVFPNHHRALWALIKYEHKLGGVLPAMSNNPRPTAECYIKRAINYYPKDMKVRQLYGSYFHLRKEYKKALKQYAIAEKHMPDSGELAYNMGLAYFEVGDYEKANEMAKKAIRLKFKLKGLKRKLKKAGKWKD